MEGQDLANPGGGGGGGAAVATELRRSYRRAMLAAGVMELEGVAGAAGQRAVRVVDLSVDGVGIRSPMPIGVGNVFVLRIQGHPAVGRSRVRAVHCRRSRDGEYEVGGEFLEPPPA